MAEYRSPDERLAAIERRLDALEALSHPPADLAKPAWLAMARVLREASDAARAKA